MQLKDLIKTLDDLSEEELIERLREIRHRRSVERPASKAIVERHEKKQSRGRMSALDKLINSLSEEDRARLLADLEGSTGNGGSQGGASGTGEVP